MKDTRTIDECESEIRSIQRAYGECSLAVDNLEEYESLTSGFAGKIRKAKRRIKKLKKGMLSLSIQDGGELSHERL